MGEEIPLPDESTVMDEVYAFHMVQNPFVRFKRFVLYDLRHDTGKGYGQLIRFIPTERIRKIALCVCVNEQHFLSLPCKPDPEVYGSRGFPDAAFLIGDGNYFWHGHFPLFDFMYKLCISLKNAVQAIPPLWAVETASPAIFITFGTTGLKRSDLGFCRMNSSSACRSPSENTFRLRTSPAGIKNGATLPLKGVQ